MQGNVGDKVEKAFAKLHQLHVLHGDVRAANIIVASESVWIIDYEYASIIEDSKLFESEKLEVKKLLEKIKSGKHFT